MSEPAKVKRIIVHAPELTRGPGARRFSRSRADDKPQRIVKEYPPGSFMPAPPLVPGMGLGDLVAAVAQPIARAIDNVAGTNLVGCEGCKSRQEALNQLAPNLISKKPTTEEKP